MWEGSESFKQVAHVAAGEGLPIDRSRFEETLRKCVAAASIDVKRSVLIVGASFRDAHSLYRLGFRRMTLFNVEPLWTSTPRLSRCAAGNGDGETMRCFRS
jgi:hypothetical protein